MYFENVFGSELSSQIEQLGDQIVFTANPTQQVHLTRVCLLLLIDIADILCEDWFMGGFGDAILVAGVYFLFVIVGSLLMKGIFGSKESEKTEAKSGGVIAKIANEPVLIVALVYNPTQVILCGYMILEALKEAQKEGYSLICNPYNPQKTGMAAVLWVFYLSKILDFVDTVIIILRCKWRQLTFLHVYHHISIFLVYWLNLRGGYDGDIYYTIVLNSFVHLVMYAYYQATTLDIKVPKTLKMLVTKLQMIQFITMNVQAIYIIYFKCPYPQYITWFYLFYIVSLFILFQNFASKTYVEKKKYENPSADASSKKATKKPKAE